MESTLPTCSIGQLQSDPKAKGISEGFGMLLTGLHKFVLKTEAPLPLYIVYVETDE